MSIKVEKSSGSLVFTEKNGSRLWLLLSRERQSKDEKVKGKLVWDFPKGNVEKGEKVLDTAKREVEEETGLPELEFLDGFKKTIRLFYQWEGEKRLKFITFFLARSATDNVTISFEHEGFAWLSYHEARKRLTFKNGKDILDEAEAFAGALAR